MAHAEFRFIWHGKRFPSEISRNRFRVSCSLSRLTFQTVSKPHHLLIPGGGAHLGDEQIAIAHRFRRQPSYACTWHR